MGQTALYKNAMIATMKAGKYDLIEKGDLLVEDGKIKAIGTLDVTALETHDCAGKLMTPALIDCHTHLVYGGNRAAEFEMRLQGVSYEEIAKQGGGIASTVRMTREATEDALFEAAKKRMEIFIAQGVGTIEIKSGYGLDLETERKMLRVIKRLKNLGQATIRASFLGAHAQAPEFGTDKDAYIDHIISEMLPALHEEGLIDAVDGFCEGIAFSPQQIERVFRAAQGLGLPLKLHAEQLSNLGGAKMAAEYGALSADHIEYLDEDGVRAMAQHGTVGVILPGAFYILKETQKPPVGLMREYNVPMAIASDHNPGSAPVLSLLLMMNMACTFFGLTPEEALAGVTLNAAKALGLGARKGSLEIGKDADFVLWDCTHPAELSYFAAHNFCHSRVFSGLA